jgi:hypothetical protein
VSGGFKQHFQTGANAMLTAGLAATMVAGGMTHEAPAGGWTGEAGSSSQMEATHAAKPANVPSWNKHLSRQFDGFRDIEHKPEGAIASRVAVVGQDASATTMGVDRAHRLTHDKTPANDVWVVGGRW